jgi:uncharacterized FAD-dependent dehydrogenase
MQPSRDDAVSFFRRGFSVLARYDVVVVGAGPAGIFCVLELIKQGVDLKVLMLEKGPDLFERTCPGRKKGTSCIGCSSCAVVSGWGGAGAFSDGKLALSADVGGMLDNYLSREELEEGISYVHQLYLEFGAPEKVYGLERQEEIEALRRKALLAGLRFVHAPVRHLGTGRTQVILHKIKDYLLAHGVEIQTRRGVSSFLVKNGVVGGVVTEDGELIEATYVVCAPGRYGAEWLSEVASRLNLQTEINPVDIGLRVELPAVVMEPLTQLTYEAKFVYSSPTFEDKVRTFCMNPYGEVVMENVDGIITVNGHTHAEKKTDYTNFALLVSKSFTEPFKEPIAYGKYIARLANLLSGGVIVQRLGDLIAGRRSTEERIARGIVTPTLKEATPGDLSLVLPYRHFLAIIEMLKAMDQVTPGIYSRDTLLYGVEVKFYSSRLKLSRVLETEVQNLFGAGDGVGVTRGLTQASLSGVIVGREIAHRVRCS